MCSIDYDNIENTQLNPTSHFFPFSSHASTRRAGLIAINLYSTVLVQYNLRSFKAMETDSFFAISSLI